MKKPILIIVIFISNSLMAQSDGWKNLFDGKTLKGWHQLNGKSTFEIKNATITGTTVPNESNSFLATDEIFGDFILEVTLKVGDMNSGIQIRSLSIPEFENGRVHGYQVEVDPGPRDWSGGIYDEARRGWMYQTDMNPAAKKAFNKTGWNRYHIEAIGPIIRTWVNDIPVAYVVDDMTMRGFIALQIHSIKDGDAIQQIQWKNLSIQTGKDIKARPLDNITPVANYTLQTLSPQEIAQGFSFLFNGKDLSGWRSVGKTTAPEKGWEVIDGTLHVMDSLHSGRPGDLVTIQQFKAFELNFEFKLTPGANSGVKYFVSETLGSKSGLGLEYQVLDDALNPDAKEGVEGNRTLASLYDLIPSIKIDPRYQRKIGDWNQAKIRVYPNNHIEHWLNGYKVVEYERGNNIYKVLVAHSKYAKNKGFGMNETTPILFQEHGENVFYRNIKIRKY